MNKLFSRWLPCATLATWSTVLLYMYYSGRIDAFLIPAFRTYVGIAGTLLLGMAMIFLLFPADADCCSSAECGHGLSRLASGKILTFLILLLPVTAAAVFSPDGFSKDAILNRGIITDATGLRPPGASKVSLTQPDLPLPTNDPQGTPAATPIPLSPQAQSFSMEQYFQRTPDGRIIAEVLDLLYAAQDDALRADFNDKPVELIGQMMPDRSNNANGHRFKAVRMFMTCCAADARPVATLVESEKMPDVPEMTWVKITGKATFPIENGKRISVIKAEKVEKTEPPDETMLF
jgi:uncharacterized repeat protein (TIGR03943 family)